MSIADIAVLPVLYPCEFCQTPCLMPANELPAGLRRGSRCEACAPGWVEQRFYENQASELPPPSPLNIAGVYVVQLRQRQCVLKIGQSCTIRERLSSVRSVYGPLTCLYAIPAPQPAALEKAFHAQFQPFRVYDGAQKSELFAFATRKAQRAFTGIMSPYKAYRLALPSWQAPVPTPSAQLRFC